MHEAALCGASHVVSRIIDLFPVETQKVTVQHITPFGKALSRNRYDIAEMLIGYSNHPILQWFLGVDGNRGQTERGLLLIHQYRTDLAREIKTDLTYAKDSWLFGNFNIRQGITKLFEIVEKKFEIDVKGRDNI